MIYITLPATNSQVKPMFVNFVVKQAGTAANISPRHLALVPPITNPTSLHIFLKSPNAMFDISGYAARYYKFRQIHASLNDEDTF
jgi:hypothetical protein